VNKVNKNKKSIKVKEIAEFYSYWSNYPRYYNFLSCFFGYHEYLKRKAIKMLDIKDNNIILDIGCGPGSSFKLFKKYGEGVQIIGVDCSSGMIEKSSKRKVDKVKLICGDIANMKLLRVNKAVSIKSFSAILEHEKALDNVYNSLLKGGKLVIFDMVPNKFMKFLRYGKSYQEKDLVKVIKRKFKKVKILKYPLGVFIAVIDR